MSEPMSEARARLEHMLKLMDEAAQTLETVQMQIAEITANPLHVAPAPEIVRSADALSKTLETLALAQQALAQLADKIDGKKHRADEGLP